MSKKHSLADTIHKGAYITSTDPATTYSARMQAEVLWIDTTATPYKVKKRNAGNTGWDLIGYMLPPTAAADSVVQYKSSAWAERTMAQLYADLKPIIPIELVLTVGDESTAITTGTAKLTFRTPCAITLTGVRASLNTAQATGSIFTVDINEGGTTILSTKLTIDNTEKTSTTAATAAVISDANLANDAEITVDVDQVGDGTAKGLKIVLIGYRA